MLYIIFKSLGCNWTTVRCGDSVCWLFYWFANSLKKTLGSDDRITAATAPFCNVFNTFFFE